MNLSGDMTLDATGMKDTFSRILCELAENDTRVVYLDSDLSMAAGVKNTFASKHPGRFIDCGIQEANMAGVACGLSSSGMIPFIHSFASFISRKCTDQIFLSGCFAKQNVKIIGSDPGITAEQNGATHAGCEDIGIFRNFPGINILDPCDAVSFEAALKLAKETYGMFYVRYIRKPVKKIYAKTQKFEVGKGNILRDGGDITIIASGIMVAEALEAAKILEAESIHARVVDMFTIKPLDTELVIKCAKETGAIVTAENHNLLTGLGSAVALACSMNYPVPIGMVGINDQFGQVGNLAYQMKFYGLTAPDIVEKTRETKGKR